MTARISRGLSPATSIAYSSTPGIDYALVERDDPTDFADTRPPRAQSPVQHLAFALMADALRQLRCDLLVLRAEAAWWLVVEQSERPCSLAWCCAVLNLDVDAVREGIGQRFRLPPAEFCEHAAQVIRHRYGLRRPGVAGASFHLVSVPAHKNREEHAR